MDFQEQREKAKRRRFHVLLSKGIFVGLVFTLWIAYFLCPLSHVTNRSITGEHYYTDAEILDLAGVSSYDSLYLIRKNKILDSLKKVPLLDDVSVKLSPFGLKISFTEIDPVFSYGDTYYLSNGQVLDGDLFSDSLVGDKLHEIVKADPLTGKDNIVPLLTLPESEKFDMVRYTTLCNALLSLDSAELQQIVYASFDSVNYCYTFYYETGESNHLLKYAVADGVDVTADYLAGAITSEAISKVMENYAQSRDKLVEFDETLEEKTYAVESFKVVISVESGKAYYNVITNNPTVSE